VLPDVNSSGVILQGAVIVTFDQAIDVATYQESSFLLSVPPEQGSIDPTGQLGLVSPVSGTDYVDGTFSFSQNGSGATIATFRPSRTLRPNVTYTVLISTDVTALDGTTLSTNYTWKFTTGILNLTTPLRQNPLPSQVGRIQPKDLIVTPRSSINNDLHQIEIKLGITQFDIHITYLLGDSPLARRRRVQIHYWR